MKGKTLIVREFGNPEEVIQIEEKVITHMRPNDVLVRMILRPINPSDLIPLQGSYAHRITLPTTPGYEGVGIVEAVGASVRHIQVGERVLPLCGEGTWQELVRTDAKYVVKVPHTIDDVTAAQLYINPITAWITTQEILQLKKGDFLVVNACNSAIGHIIIQLSKIKGFHVIAIVRNIHNRETLMKLGAYAVFSEDEENLISEILTLTNHKGVDAVIDAVGGEQGTKLAFTIRTEGIFLTIGLLSGIQVDWQLIAERTKAKPQLFHLRHWNARVSNTDWHETFKKLINLIEKEQLKLAKAEAIYPLLDFQDALYHLKNKQGKVFLKSNCK